MLIIVNSIFLALEDPTLQTQADYLNLAEEIFLYLYTVEMVLKMLAMGVILNRGSYLRDPWYILDFTVIVTGYISTYMNTANGINLSGLRSLRVLRPLKTVTAIKKLRSLVLTIFNAIPYLLEIMVVMVFVFMIFAIAALQLFQGLLQNSCTDLPTGKLYLDIPNGNGPFLCSSADSCPTINNGPSTNYTQLVCAKNNENPEFNQLSFDNIFRSFLMIYVTTTLEGWSEIMVDVMSTLHWIIAIFFVFIVFMCSFFIINLTLAVITIKFNESQENTKSEEMARIKHSSRH